MITKIEVENYKSIDTLSIELGRINVFIGENGAGKSNILEVIALGAAASAGKLDNEFLTARGVRVTRPELMRSAFPESNQASPIRFSCRGEKNESVNLFLQNDNQPYSKWKVSQPLKTEVDKSVFDKELRIFLSNRKIKFDEKTDDIALYEKFTAVLEETTKELHEAEPGTDFRKFLSERFFPVVDLAKKISMSVPEPTHLKDFIIYSPENSALRTFKSEGQVEPLGINGEGLLRLISVYASENKSKVLEKVKKGLSVLNWFDDFSTVQDVADAKLEIKDRFLKTSLSGIDHVSANEGFFFLLFYYVLFNSELTPNFFAIDNIDASLNPKLCRKLISELAILAEKNGKQAILTTHNPAVLDGLNLNDQNQRLFVISRSLSGSTRIKRIVKPKTDKDIPYKLSELFLSGALGGLPKGF